MNLTAVILREMRAEARRPFTYWMRVVLGAILLAVATVVMFGEIGTGSTIFGGLNLLLFISIWVIIPLLTADSISRERREGTLGLLFLTPLKASAIVIAKGFVHTLRGGSFLLTALPAITIPFLLGGVGWEDLTRAAALDFAAVLTALAVGLLVSSVSVRWSRTLVAAECFSFAAAMMFVSSHEVIAESRNGSIEQQWCLATGAGGEWLTSRSASQFNSAATMLLIAIAFFLFTFMFAGARIRKSWHEEPPTPRQAWFFRTFCTPRFWSRFFNRRMSRALDRNPIGWLQQYSWSARMTKWGWCMAMVLFGCFMPVLGDWEVAPVFVMIAAIAFTAAGSFARERQNGAMELLLVTPLSVAQIIYGRMRGVLGQFIPALAVWLLSMVLLNGFFPDQKIALILLVFATGGIACAAVGLYLSIRRLSFIAAWILTALIAIALPMLLTGVVLFTLAIFGVGFVFRVADSPEILFLNHVIIIHALLIGWALYRLRRDLSTRNFSLVASA